MRKIDEYTKQMFLLADEVKFGVSFQNYSNENLRGLSDSGYIAFEQNHLETPETIEGFSFTINCQILIHDEPLQDITGLFIVSFSGMQCRYLHYLLKEDDEIRITATVDNILPLMLATVKLEIYRKGKWLCETELPTVYLSQVGQVLRYQQK